MNFFTVAVAMASGTSLSSNWPRVKQADLHFSLHGSTWQHHELSADYVEAELDELSGNTVRQMANCTEIVTQQAQGRDKCVRLVSTSCQFFVDKVNHIHDNISKSLKSSALWRFAVWQHHGQEFPSLQPVTIGEVCKLLSSKPTKSSPGTPLAWL